MTPKNRSLSGSLSTHFVTIILLVSLSGSACQSASAPASLQSGPQVLNDRSMLPSQTKKQDIRSTEQHPETTATSSPSSSPTIPPSTEGSVEPPEAPTQPISIDPTPTAQVALTPAHAPIHYLAQSGDTLPIVASRFGFQPD